MELWIRSQGKEFLMKVDNINLGIDVDTNEPNRLFTFVGGAITSFTLGIYKTKERALEVLDEIQEFIEDKEKSNIEITSDGINQSITYPKIVYEMPKE